MKKPFSIGIFLLFSLIPVAAQEIKVTLLGTGCPAPVIDRFGPSTLVEANGERLIFDAGRGAIQRLTQARVPFKEVQAVFLTHLHSDHVVGLPDLWLTGWLNGGRTTPLLLFGPTGTEKMMGHLRQAYDFDIRIRVLEDRRPPDGGLVRATDVSEGVVYDRNGVKVTAFLVDHGPTKPAFGYRVDYVGRSVVLSGDTKPSSNLLKYAAGADLLIHEVVVPESLKIRQLGKEWEEMIASHHTTPEQAGEIFAKLKPRLAVYSHIVLPIATNEQMLAPTRKFYSGELTVGEDLMSITVGDAITIRRFGQEIRR